MSAKRPLSWPADGELDIMEHVGFDSGMIHSTIHCKSFNGAAGTQKGGQIKINDPYNTFHIYKMDWNSKRVQFFVDNKLFFTYTKQGNSKDTWPYDGEMNIIINNAIGDCLN